MPQIVPFLIKVGTVATFGAAGGAVAGIIGATVVIGATVAASRILKPKINFNIDDNDRSRQQTVRSTIEPRKLVYGETMVSGPLTYAKVTGSNNEYLHQVIALAGHELTSIKTVFFDDKSIDLTGSNYNSTTKLVTGGFFGPKDNENGVSESIVYIDTRLGAATQTAFAGLRSNSETSSEYLATHRGDGVAAIYTRWLINEGSAETWDEVGNVQNIKCVVQGKKVYDPRLDVNAGNTAGANPTNASYIKYDDDSLSTGSAQGNYDRGEQGKNPALQLADFLMDSDFGLGIPSSKIDWDAVVTAADICDQLVPIPNSAVQKRFSGSGVIFGADTYSGSISKILSAMNGSLVYSQGKYIMTAGKYVSPSETLTEDDLVGPVQIRTAIPRSDRVNTIKGLFIDPSENYKMMEFGPVTIGASDFNNQTKGAVARDNGEVLTEEVKLPFTDNRYQAQRLALMQVAQSYHQTIVTVPVNLKGMRIAIGDRVNLTLSDFNDVDSGNWSPKVFKCIGWRFADSGEGINLTLIEDDSNNYNDPEASDYSTITAAGVISTALPDVPSPSALTLTSQINAIELNWTNPSNIGAWEQIWIYRNTTGTTPTDSDTPIAKLRASSYIDQRAAADAQGNAIEYYYWIQAVRYPQGSTPSSGSTNKAKSAMVAAGTPASGKIAATKIGQGVMDSDSVGAAQVINGDIGSDQIATTLESTNYVADTSGWQINKDGTVYFQEATIVGDITATSGTFSGTVSVTAGSTAPTISGTTLAGKGILLKSDGDMLIGDTAGKYLFFDQSAGEFLVNAQVETANFTLDPSATVTGQIEASSVADGSITVADLSQTVWNEIDRRLSGVVGSTVGDYKTAAGNVGSGATNVDLAAFTHASNDITLELNIDDYWSSSNDYSGSALQATLQFQRSTDSSFPTSGEHATVDVGSAKTITIYQVDFSYMGGGYAYRVSYDATETITGTGLAAGTYYFRAKFSSAGSAWADDTSVAVNFFANEDGTGATATGGNATTLDSLDSTQFLRSDTDDTFTGDLTVTGTLILQGSIDQYNVTDLNVTDKTITVNSGNTQTLSDGAGLIVDRDEAASASLLWDETNTEFDLSHDLNLGTKSIQALQLHGSDPTNYFIKPEASSGTAISVQGNITASGSVNGTTISAGGNTIVDISQNLQNIGTITTTKAMASSPYIHHFDVSGDNTVGGGAGIVLQTSVTAGTTSVYGGKIEAVRTSSDDGSADLKFYTSKASNSNGAHQLVLTLDEDKAATFNGTIITSGNIQQDYGSELRGKDSNGTARTLLRTNSNKLQIGWSYAGDVEFMGGGSYTKRMAISGSTGDVSIVNDLSVSGSISTADEIIVDVPATTGGGTGPDTFALLFKNTSVNYTADALTAYNAATSWDMPDSTTFMASSRPTNNSIFAYMSEFNGPVINNRYIQLDDSATHGSGMIQNFFYHYDGAGNTANDFKQPVGKLETWFKFQSGATTELVSITGAGFVQSLGYGINGTTVIDGDKNVTARNVTASDTSTASTPLTIGSSSQTNYTLQRWLTSSHSGNEAYIIAYGADHSGEAGNFAMKNVESGGDLFFELSGGEMMRLSSTGMSVENKIIAGNGISAASPVLLELHNSQSDIDGTGNSGHGNFINFKMTDDNATFTPQVQIGMLVKDYSGDAGLQSEGMGNFVVKTGQGTDSSGGGTLTERFRVTEDGRGIFSGNVELNSRLTFNSNSHYFEAGTNSVSFKNSSATTYATINNSGIDTSGTITADGLRIDHSTHTGVDFNFTDSNSNSSFYGMHIDHNISGSDALDADYTKAAIYVDMDNSSNAGTTSNELRMTGIYSDVRTTGDSDVVRGYFGHAESNHSSGTISTVAGGFFQGTADHSGSAVTTNIYGVYGVGTSGGEGTGSTANVYGLYGKSATQTVTHQDTTQLIGVYAEAEISDPGASNQTTIGSVFGINSQIDYNGAGNVTVNNGYLFYGNYAGTLPTTAWGVYIADDVRSRFGGTVETKDGSESTPSHSFYNDRDIGMYRVTTNQLGFSTGGTNRLTITSSGLFTQDLTYDNRGALNSQTDTGQIILGAYNGPADGTGTSQGPAIVWKPNYTSYTKESLKIAGVATNNYFDMDMVFYTNGGSSQTSSITERFRLTQGGEAVFAADITAPNLRLTDTDDLALDSTAHAFQVGSSSGLNIAMDNNEIMARNNGSASSLHLNAEGGNVTFNNVQSGSVSLYMSGTQFMDSNRNLTNIGTIASDNITVDDRLVIEGAAIYDNATNGNNKGFRIGGAGLVPSNGSGTQTNALVDIGTNDYKFKEAFFSDAVNANSFTINNTEIVTSGRQLQNLSAFYPASTVFTGGDYSSNLQGNYLADHMSFVSPFNSSRLYCQAMFKDAEIWGKNASTQAWSKIADTLTGTLGNIFKGYAGAQSSGAFNLSQTYDEFIIYFGTGTSSSLGYAFIGMLKLEHSTNGHNFVAHLETKESFTNVYESGWTSEYTTGTISSWPGATSHKVSFGVGSGSYRDDLRLRIVPNWSGTYPNNSITLYNVNLLGQYGSRRSLFAGWTHDRKLTFQNQIRIQGGSVSNPSLAITGDEDTGLFGPAVNKLGLVTGGTERVRVDSDGISVTGSITSTNNIINDIGNSGDDSYIELKNTGYTGNVTSLRQNADSTRAELNSTERSIHINAASGGGNTNAEVRLYANQQLGYTLDADKHSTFGGQVIINESSVNALKIEKTTNSGGIGIYFSDHVPSSGNPQAGYLDFFHSDGLSYGSGASFKFSTSESSLAVLVDGSLLFKDGVYLKPSSGTGVGTLLINNSGVFRAASGSVSAPGISFNADTNTGIYRIAENRMGFATAGVKRSEIDASGNTLIYGRTFLRPTTVTNAIRSANATMVVEATEGQLQVIADNGGDWASTISLSNANSANTIHRHYWLHNAPSTASANAGKFELRTSSTTSTSYVGGQGSGSSVLMVVDTSGNATFTANVTAYSDERLKTDIKTLDGSKVLEMRGVSYTRDGEAGSGVIAQELEKVASELVHTADDDMGTKSVAYGNLTGYLIEAVKMQAKQIAELEKAIKELKENGDD